jgi:hypothetical protein
MFPTYNYVTAFLGITTAIIIFLLVRKDALSSHYSLWWIVIALGLMVMGVFPQIIDGFGRLLGISYPPILLAIFGLCFMLIKLLFMDIDRSRQERQIRVLSQRLSIYESLAEKGDPDSLGRTRDTPQQSRAHTTPGDSEDPSEA